MPADFDFLEPSLHEPRAYRVRRGGERLIVETLATSDGLDILRDTDDYTLICATNLMNPGTPDGARSIERRFGVELPPEFHQFYQRWDGGVLIYRSIYFILSSAQIIETAVEFRDVQEMPLDLPWHVLRFCEVADEDYVALRRRAPSDWEAIYASGDNPETDYLYPQDARVDARGVVAPSFSEWLRKVHDTDGWPWGEHLPLRRNRPPCERVW